MKEHGLLPKEAGFAKEADYDKGLDPRIYNGFNTAAFRCKRFRFKKLFKRLFPPVQVWPHHDPGRVPDPHQHGDGGSRANPVPVLLPRHHRPG